MILQKLNTIENLRHSFVNKITNDNQINVSENICSKEVNED